MSDLIAWQNLPDFVPGTVRLCSDNLDWSKVALRSYLYDGQDVVVPAMKDFMLVGYRSGVTPMQRRFDGRWSHETLSPGAASFLTRAQSAHWVWQAPIEVTHIYLSPEMMTDVASEMFDCVVSNVALDDVLRTEDPIITSTMTALAHEARLGGLGGAIYVESLTRALIVHLLRHHAQTKVPKSKTPSNLGSAHKRIIADFVSANLSQPIDLTAMASQLGMKPCLFARQFKTTFGIPPYRYVLAQRVERARHLLTKSNMALKEIAADCGFSDQAHMTRMFKRAYGTSPLAYRTSA